MRDEMFHCPSCLRRYELLTYDSSCLQLECFGEPLQQGAGEGSGATVDPDELFDQAWTSWNAEGNDQDASTALRLFKEAAELGHSQAQYNLGVLYANGIEFASDASEAVRWYRIAAERGHRDAQNNLGMMYVNGAGVDQDAVEGARWYRMSAEQGNADAQSNLGWMYANGAGVEQDSAEAIRWCRSAAEQGHAQAATLLTQLTADNEASPWTGHGNANRDGIILSEFDAWVCSAMRGFKPTLTMG